MNYAAALVRLRQYESALKVALECIGMDSRNPKAVSNLLLSAYYADDQAVIDEWLPKYEKLTGAAHEVADWLHEDTEDEAELPAILKEAEDEGYIPLDKLKEELGI